MRHKALHYGMVLFLIRPALGIVQRLVHSVWAQSALPCKPPYVFACAPGIKGQGEHRRIRRYYPAALPAAHKAEPLQAEGTVLIVHVAVKCIVA